MIKQLNAAEGIRAYPRDGREGAITAELDGFILELDQEGVYEILRQGESAPGRSGAVVVSLDFLPADVAQAAYEAGSGSDPVTNVREAVKAAKNALLPEGVFLDRQGRPYRVGSLGPWIVTECCFTYATGDDYGLCCRACYGDVFDDGPADV